MPRFLAVPRAPHRHPSPRGTRRHSAEFSATSPAVLRTSHRPGGVQGNFIVKLLLGVKNTNYRKKDLIFTTEKSKFPVHTRRSSVIQKLMGLPPFSTAFLPPTLLFSFSLNPLHYLISSSFFLPPTFLLLRSLLPLLFIASSSAFPLFFPSLRRRRRDSKASAHPEPSRRRLRLRRQS